MITYVNNSNAGQYRILYEKATRELMAHNEENLLVKPSEINEQTNRPLIMPTVCTEEDLAEGVYESGKYYKWNAELNVYESATEATPSETETYYKASDITSLNEYFSYIKNLAEINPVYTVLPLDEDTFDVDLNTRKITVPNHFVQNGISVQGDEVAEVVYFKVNRFFDAQDLANEDIKIYIQWRCAQADADGKLIEGVSVPWVVDLETEPNYILFGWPISSKITGKAGDISFAVRFFKFQDRKIVYSLSTLTQNVKVQPSLDFDIAQQLIDALDGTDNSSLVVDDSTNMILSRLENSQVINGGVQAEKPFFFVVSNPGPNGTTLTTAIDTEAGDNGVVGGVTTSVGLVPEFWLAEGNTPGLYNTPTIFKVAGSSHDGGRISYSWRKLNINTKETEPIVYSNQMLKTDDTSAQLGKVYYKKVVNGADEAFEQVSTPIFDPDDDEYAGPLYERYSVAQIPGVGYYVVTISNRVQNSLAKKESIMMVVAMPLVATIETPLGERAWLLADAGYKTTISVGAVPQDNSYLTYQWYYNETGEGGVEQATAIEGANAAAYEVSGTKKDTPEDGVAGDGYYYVVVTSNMNGSSVQIDGNANGIRVTHGASKPTVTLASQQSYNLTEVALAGGIKVQAEIDSRFGERRTPDDSITYQWYKYKADEGHTVEQDRQKAENGEYTFSGDILIEGATEPSFVPSLSGFYYCKVTNTYNEKTAEAYSKFFYIDD